MNQAVLFILLIVAINITYVSLTTVRLILMIKGLRGYASALSIFEVFVYIMGLSIILNNLNSIWNIAAYCLGYAMGVYIGSIIEERLALGYITAEVIVDSVNNTFPQELRNNGFGVTSWIGEGRDGLRLVMIVLAKRKRQKELLKLIDTFCPTAFVVFEEPKYFRGGFWTTRLAKRKG
ncbi:MAG: hypothetical protein APF84_11335 [Gracilibacter sp. BRH_c7a]|nr:MAG: hypothetical protein APF84_11335 [Gracilibacter sp. BRH_c7a]